MATQAADIFKYSTIVLLDTAVNSLTYFKNETEATTTDETIQEIRTKIWNVGIFRQIVFILTVLFWSKSLASRFTKSVYINVAFGILQAYYSSVKI